MSSRAHAIPAPLVLIGVAVLALGMLCVSAIVMVARGVVEGVRWAIG